MVCSISLVFTLLSTVRIRRVVRDGASAAKLLLRILFDSSCEEPDQLAVDPAETKGHTETLRVPDSSPTAGQGRRSGSFTRDSGSHRDCLWGQPRNDSLILPRDLFCKGQLTRPHGNPGSRRPSSNSSAPPASRVTPCIHCANLGLISTQLAGPQGPYVGHPRRMTDVQATCSHEGQVCPTPGRAQAAESGPRSPGGPHPHDGLQTGAIGPWPASPPPRRCSVRTL